jgi:hypothetical protein
MKQVQLLTCKKCGKPFEPPDEYEYKDELFPYYDHFDPERPICPSCALLFPPAILKAMNDPFYYVVGLRNGMVIYFDWVEDIYGEWIVLRLWEGEIEGRTNPPELPPCPRGLEVRLSDIVWAADAPFGS